MWQNVSLLKPKEYYQDIGLTFTQCRYHFYIIPDWVIIQEHFEHLQWQQAYYLMKQLIPSWDSSTRLKSLLYTKLNLSSCNFHPLPFGVIPSKSNSLYKSRPIHFRKQLWLFPTSSFCRTNIIISFNSSSNLIFSKSVWKILNL